MLGTNPEELIASAHAGCFSMAFQPGPEQRRVRPEKHVNTTAKVHINRKPEGGFIINKIELTTEAEVGGGISDAQFQEIAEWNQRPVARCQSR